MKLHVVSTSFLALSATLLAVALVAMLYPVPACISPGEFHFHDLGWALAPFAFGAALLALLLAVIRAHTYRAAGCRCRTSRGVGLPVRVLGAQIVYLADSSC